MIKCTSEQIKHFIGYSPRLEVKDIWSWTLLTPAFIFMPIAFLILTIIDGEDGHKLDPAATCIYVMLIIVSVVCNVLLYFDAKSRLKRFRETARIVYERNGYTAISIWGVVFSHMVIQNRYLKFKEPQGLVIAIAIVLGGMLLSYFIGRLCFKLLISMDYYTSEFAKNKLKRFGRDDIKGTIGTAVVILVKHNFGETGLTIVVVIALFLLPIVVSGYQLKLDLAKKYKMEDELIGFGTYLNHE